MGNGDGKAGSSQDNLTDGSQGATTVRSNDPGKPQTRAQQRRSRVRAFCRSLLVIDHTQLALVPGTRTALIIMLDWSIMGIGNPTTTAFQLGCLYVGLTDPSGSLSRRLHYMGLTLICVILMGTLLPALVWRYPWVHFVAAFVVAFATGLSPLLGSPALFLAMKLGTALFAINGAVNRNTNGYGGIDISICYTLFGGSMSLLAAVLPEVIGSRDAVRTDLFKVYHGFGTNLKKWSAHWGTLKHFRASPVPFVTLSIAKTQDIIFHDTTEDPKAREWLLGIMYKADNIRAASLCLSNGYGMTRHVAFSSSADKHTEIHDLFVAVGCACLRIARSLQFPWAVRYSPCLKNRLVQAVIEVEKAVTALKNRMADPDWIAEQEISMTSLPALAKLLETNVKDTVNQVLDAEHWPPFSSSTTLPRRIAAAFPSELKGVDKDEAWVIRGYAVRFAIAFSLASIPELFMPRHVSGHWFPMTVALIMGPTYAATFEKVAHRTVGTLLGIGLGSAMYPLFDVPWVLIVLLGLNTYAVCVFFQASYVAFTFFITAWVFCTTVGVGAKVGSTILYRCVWTLAAAVLVTFVTYVYPPKTEYKVTEKLAAMAKATKDYAKAVKDDHIQQCSSGEAEVHQNKLEAAQMKVQQTRKYVIKARVAMLTCINEAVLTPNEPFLVDPHSVAPMLASDLIDAVVVPQAISLLGEQCDADLLSDLSEETFAEIDRLVARLEHQASLPTTIKDASSPMAEREEAATVSTTSEGRNAFANAIACCNRRLDEAGVPS